MRTHQNKSPPRAVAAQDPHWLLYLAPLPCGYSGDTHTHGLSAFTQLLQFQPVCACDPNANQVWNLPHSLWSWISPNSLQSPVANDAFIISPVHADDPGRPHLAGDARLLRHWRRIGHLHKHQFSRNVYIPVPLIGTISYIDHLKFLSLRFSGPDMRTREAGIVSPHRLQERKIRLQWLAVIGEKLILLHFQSHGPHSLADIVRCFFTAGASSQAVRCLGRQPANRLPHTVFLNQLGQFCWVTHCSYPPIIYSLGHPPKVQPTVKIISPLS